MNGYVNYSLSETESLSYALALRLSDILSVCPGHVPRRAVATPFLFSLVIKDWPQSPRGQLCLLVQWPPCWHGCPLLPGVGRQTPGHTSRPVPLEPAESP